MGCEEWRVEREKGDSYRRIELIIRNGPPRPDG
jgi:hypothetical protein